MFEPLFDRREGISGQSARAVGLRPLVTLQINAHAFAADLNERMRHRAALALARVQSIAFGNDAAEDADVKFFRDDDVVNRDDKMIEGLGKRHRKAPQFIYLALTKRNLP